MTDIARLSVPITLWLAAFSAVFGLQGLVCSDRWPTDVQTGHAALIGAWLIAIALQAAVLLALRSRRFASPQRFIQNVSLALAAVALAAAVWTLIPVATTTPCL